MRIVPIRPATDQPADQPAGPDQVSPLASTTTMSRRTFGRFGKPSRRTFGRTSH